MRKDSIPIRMADGPVERVTAIFIDDRPIDMTLHIQRKLQMGQPVRIPPHIHNEWDWREVPMPAPTRIVETTALPAPVRVKGVIE